MYFIKWVSDLQLMELFEKIDNRFENDVVPMYFIKRVSDLQLMEVFENASVQIQLMKFVSDLLL
jgi:hypothetical protein